MQMQTDAPLPLPPRLPTFASEKAPSCDYPTGSEACGEPVVWTTDDLQEVHHLCAEHCIDAFLSNDFVADRVTP